MFKRAITTIRAPSLDTEVTVVAVASDLVAPEVTFIKEVAAEATVEDLVVAAFYIEATITTLMSI